VGDGDAEIPAGVAIVASYPEGQTGVKPISWTAKASEVTTVSASWRLRVSVVCADTTD
jgi:hypothetical protein